MNGDAIEWKFYPHPMSIDLENLYADVMADPAPNDVWCWRLGTGEPMKIRENTALNNTALKMVSGFEAHHNIYIYIYT